MRQTCQLLMLINIHNDESLQYQQIFNPQCIVHLKVS